MNEREALRKLLQQNPDLTDVLIAAFAEGRVKDVSEVHADEEAVIIGGPDHAGITGAKQAKCACGAVVWLSPSSQELLKARDAAPTRIICMSCVVKEA